MRARAGMTLGEVMIVTVVLGILAAVAIPSYQKSVEQGYRREAQDLLLTIYHGERAYFFAEREYHGPLDDSSAQAEWRRIFLDNPSLGSVPVTFDVQVDNSDADSANRTFTATASRVGGSGGSKTMTIDQLRKWCGGTTDPASCDGTWAP
jgi:type IV pilus assembly protein PilE